MSCSLQPWKGRGSKRVPILLFLIASIVLAAATPLAIGNSDVSTGQESRALTSASEGVATGHMARTSDGVIHFAWAECAKHECLSDPVDERLVIRHRTYDPATQVWSSERTVMEHETNLAYPRMYPATDGIHLIWLQGWERNSADPTYLWHCVLNQDLECSDPKKISPGTGQALFPEGIVGPEGRFRVAWQEEHPDTTTSRLLFRELSPQGWGPVVEFPTDARWQRNAALAVDPEGRTHVAWTEKPQGTIIQETDEIIVHAVMEPDGNTASKPQRLSEEREGPVFKNSAALVEHEGTVHVFYSTMHDLHHRSLPPGEPEWTQSVNVSRDRWSGGGMYPWITVTPESTLLAGWVNTTTEGYTLWTAEFVDGLWHRPQPVYGPHEIHNPAAFVDATNALHVAWTGRQQMDDPAQMYYFQVGHSDRDLRAPEIGKVRPAPGGWTNQIDVRLDAEIFLDTAINWEKTTWWINGEALDYDVSNGTIHAVATNVSQGRHEALLFVQDASGKDAFRSWEFQVDRVPPEFTAIAANETGATNVTGWTTSPVTIDFEVDDKGGAPARIQIRAEEHFPWGDLLRFEEGLELEEGWLYELDFRAIDEAGNTAIPVSIQAGWDATPPQILVDPPSRWWRSADLRLDYEPLVEPEIPGSGSPEWIRFTLEPLNDESTNRTTTVLVDDERTRLTGIPDGDYHLHIHVFDEAGNVQDPDPGPYRVGIDTRVPELHLSETGDGDLEIRARDDLSGLHRLILQDTTGGSLQDWTFEGDREAQVVVPGAELRQVASVWLEDRAGNAVLARPTDMGWDVEDATPPLPEDEEETDSDAIPSNPANRIDGGRESIPLPTLAFLFVAIMTFFASHRKRRRSPPAGT